MTDGVFDEVTEADPEEVNVLLDEADIDALDDTEFVAEEVEVVDEQALEVPDRAEVAERVKLFVALEDPETVVDMVAQADDVDVGDGDSVASADAEAVLLAVLLGVDEAQAEVVEDADIVDEPTPEAVTIAVTVNVGNEETVPLEENDGLSVDCDETDSAGDGDALDETVEFTVVVTVPVTDTEEVPDEVEDTDVVELDEEEADDVAETDRVELDEPVVVEEEVTE